MFGEEEEEAVAQIQYVVGDTCCPASILLFRGDSKQGSSPKGAMSCGTQGGFCSFFCSLVLLSVCPKRHTWREQFTLGFEP